MSSLKTGDLVEWTSHSHSRVTTKTGRVVSVVPAGRSVKAWISASPELSLFADNHKDKGRARKRESYLVVVGNKLYWPRVGGLTKVGVYRDPRTVEGVLRAAVASRNKVEACVLTKLAKNCLHGLLGTSKLDEAASRLYRLSERLGDLAAAFSAERSIKKIKRRK